MDKFKDKDNFFLKQYQGNKKETDTDNKKYKNQVKTVEKYEQQIGGQN